LAYLSFKEKTMIDKKKKELTLNEAIKKAQAYCAYQERCQQEVRSKLYEWGLKPNEVENSIANLISDNFLNEERFAKTYAGGKFRIKKWGKEKIILELKKRKISDYCIRKAIGEIEETDYLRTLSDIIAKKGKSIQNPKSKIQNFKIGQYAISKGYEPELVWDTVKNLFA